MSDPAPVTRWVIDRLPGEPWRVPVRVTGQWESSGIDTRALWCEDRSSQYDEDVTYETVEECARVALEQIAQQRKHVENSYTADIHTLDVAARHVVEALAEAKKR